MSCPSQAASANHEALLDGLVEEVALRERVRARYADAARQAAAGTQAGDCGCGQPAGCGCASACCGPDGTQVAPFGAGLYTAGERSELPQTALLASLGCGNPTAVADLHEGETVLDLGSGDGIDVLLSARRVGSTGKAYGLDMTEEMLALARRNATDAGATNVEFLKGHIEQIPLPTDTVDVVMSNCVINLSVDKSAVFAEIDRVLVAGGRIGPQRHHQGNQAKQPQHNSRGAPKGGTPAGRPARLLLNWPPLRSDARPR